MDRAQHRKITRTREFRACTECRKRKLRCNRQHPCSACARRNDASGCAYESNISGEQGERDRRLHTATKLQHLEQLVQELQTQQELAAAGPGGPGPRAENNHYDGKLPTAPLYNGATHWSAMLEDIEDLRLAITEDDTQSDLALEDYEDDGICLIFGAKKHTSFQQVIATFLPTRTETGRLVSAYFRAKAVAAPFIHTTQFGRLYEQFWYDPSNASVLWTSILFSILDISARTAAPSIGTVADGKFATAAAHCLALGEYYKPQRFSVEASLLYAQARCLTSARISPAVATLFGTLGRLATAMGYHKDPVTVRTDLSVFEREMRRRTWSLLMQLDALISFQLGLPSSIQYWTWDTRPPTNLLDSDFDESTTELPPARSESEPTELVFYIAKHRLMSVFQKISSHALAIGEAPYRDLDALDRELRETYGALPSVFRVRSMADSVVDQPSVIVTRLCVFLIYQKSMCVLHRKYVMDGRQSSIVKCYEAALELVSRFLDIYQEFDAGGQLEAERWFMGSITWNDFLLGCASLCLLLCTTSIPQTATASSSTVDVPRLLALLQEAKSVCERQFTRSRDTHKVAKLVAATLYKFTQRNGKGVSPENLIGGIGPSHAEWGLSPDEELWGDMGTQDSTWAFMEQVLDLTYGDTPLDSCEPAGSAPGLLG